MPFDIKAYLALLLFVPLSIAMLATIRHPTTAILTVFFGGILFLPEHAAFDFPFLPPMDKNGFAAFMALVGALVLERKRLRQVKPLRGIEVFFWLMVIGNVGTALTNGDPLRYGEDHWRNGVQVAQEKILSAITPYDIVSMTVRDVVWTLIPFYLGRAILRTREDAAILFKVLIAYGLVYVPLMLFEMKMSPQLHNWIYGYMPNAFGHAVRGDGYKPTVFLNNGLAVATFMLATVIAASALHRARKSLAGIPPVGALVLNWVVLALSRNVGANVYALATVPMVLVSRGRTASRVALVLALLVVAYPALRFSGVFPVENMVTVASRLSPERAHSLNVRFVNEEMLMAKARERPWFGWGGFGRNRIYDEYGKDVSITDGEWIIRIGGRGIVGFVGSFGLLLFPILLAHRRLSRIPHASDRRLVDALTLLVAVNAVDLLPNGMFTQVPFFMAGALAGLSSGLSDPTSRR